MATGSTRPWSRRWPSGGDGGLPAEGVPWVRAVATGEALTVAKPIQPGCEVGPDAGGRGPRGGWKEIPQLGGIGVQVVELAGAGRGALAATPRDEPGVLRIDVASGSYGLESANPVIALSRFEEDGSIAGPGIRTALEQGQQGAPVHDATPV